MIDTRVTARAACAFCHWSAQHTGDDPLEVAQFLRALLLAHCATEHPEQHANKVTWLLPS